MLRCKACEQIDKGFRLLDLRDMAAGRQNFETRPLDQTVICLAVSPGENLVAVTPNDQGRHIDPVQPFAQLWIMEPRLPGEVCGPEFVLDSDIALLFRHGLSKPLFGKALIDE